MMAGGKSVELFTHRLTMGAQADDLPHVSIATSFTEVYYGVASRHPEQLSLFYGDGSVLNHGDISAESSADIKGAVVKLPLCSGVSIFSVDSQISASGGILVQVLGSLISTGKMFSQSFLLERKPDEHKLNFYCRNDIFRVLPDDSMKCIKQYKPSTPDNALLHWNRTSEGEIAPKSAPSPPTAQIPAISASPQTVVVDSPSSKVPQQQQQSRDLQEQPQHIPKSSNVGSTVPVENGATSPIRPTSATGNKDSPSASIQPVVEAAPPPPPKPSGPKTWASIVSKQASVQPINSIPASVVIPPTNVSSAGDTVVDVPTQPPNHHEGQSGHSGSYSNNYQARYNKSNNSNSNPGAGKARTFGPSAVVQLATVGSEWSGKHRELSAALSEEFSKYGYPVKHVDVKGARGIVFVEYDTADGVGAAVAAWKNGPRADGRFAGVGLDVSEKRPARYRNSGAGRGGGNGNYYGGGGGRRHHNHHQTRPTSTSG